MTGLMGNKYLRSGVFALTGFALAIAVQYMGNVVAYASLGRGAHIFCWICCMVFGGLCMAYSPEKTPKRGQRTVHAITLISFLCIALYFSSTFTEREPYLSTNLLFSIAKIILSFLVVVYLPIGLSTKPLYLSQDGGPVAARNGLFWVALGCIAGAVYCYITDYNFQFYTLLVAGIITIAYNAYSDSVGIKKRFLPKISATGILTVIAGIGIGVAVVHNFRAYAMFQTSQPLAYSTSLGAFFIFVLVGLFFCRTNFKASYPLLNLVRRIFGKKPDETEIAPTVYMYFSFVLLALGILFAAASYEFLGILGNKVPELLPRDSSLSIVFLVFLKAAFIWGPIALAVPAFLTSSAASGKQHTSTLFIGASIGALLSIGTLGFGIVEGVYIAAFVVAGAGIVGLVKSRTFFAPPMLFRMVIVTAVAAVVLSSLSPNTTLAQRMLFFIKSGIDIRYTKEGDISTLTVAQFDNEDKDRARTELYENSMYLGGISAEDRYVRLAGYMPKFYGRDYKSGAVRGYNTGIATNALFKTGLKKLIVYEKNPDKLDLQEYFASGNEHILNNPAVATIIQDPLNLRSFYQPDVILFEPGLYTFAGGWELYRTSYLEKLAEPLSSNGMVIVPMTGLSAESFEEVAGSFAAAFAEVHVFYYRLGTILVCFKEAGAKLDMDSIRSFIRQESAMFGALNVFSPYDITSGFVCVWDDKRPTGNRRPEVPYIEELALTSISARQSKQIELLESKRVSADGLAKMLKGDYDVTTMARFHSSGGEVLHGMSQFLSSADLEAPKRAAEAFRNAVETNQGDYEAKWFLNYLVKVGSVSLDNPKEEKKLDKLMKTILTGTDNEERLRTLRKLIEFTDTMEIKDIADLAKLINDTDAGVRRQLAVLLGYFKDDLSRTTVLRLIDDPDKTVVTAAISSAVSQNNVNAIPQLLDKLDDPDLLGPTVSAFKKFGSSRAAPRLADHLVRADDKTAVFILSALSNCGTPAEFNAISECLKRDSQQARESALLALRRIAERSGDKAAKTIFRSAMTDSDVFVRLQAILGIGETGGREDFAGLRDMFIEKPTTEDEILLNREILTAIGRCGGEEAKEFLLTKFDYPEVNISSAAIAAIGFTRAKGVEELLLAIAREGSFDARLAAIEGLYNLGPDDAIKFIPSFIEDENRTVRRMAIQYIAAIRSDEAHRLFRKLFDSTNLDTLADAAHFAYTTGDSSYVNILFPLINRGHKQLAAAACESIVRLADTSTLGRYCREALNHPTEMIRIAAAASLSYLSKDLPRDYPVTVLIENLSVDNSREANVAFTSALSRLTNMTNAPRVKYDSTDGEVIRAVEWWKNLTKKRETDK